MLIRIAFYIAKRKKQTGSCFVS